MTRRHEVILILVTVTAMLVCGIVVLVNPQAFQVRYHGWQMERAHQAYTGPKQVENGFVVVTVSLEAVERYEYHRQKLIELGDIAERHYRFKSLQAPTCESKHFSRLLVSGDCPSHLDFSSPHPDEPEPLQLTVWCYAADAKAWDDFVFDHDIADYRDCFMPTERGVQ